MREMVAIIKMGEQIFELESDIKKEKKMNYNLSCLETDLLINIYLLSGEQGVAEEDLISDYSINLFDLPGAVLIRPRC